MLPACRDCCPHAALHETGVLTLVLRQPTLSESLNVLSWTDLNAALVHQFFDIPITQREAVIEPTGVLDDRHRQSVAVRLGVGYGGLAYPTQ